jgi:hypothetical protein
MLYIMKKLFNFPLILVSAIILFTSCENDKPVTDKITFENLPLEESGYFIADDGSGGFTSGNAYFKTSYNPDYQSWSGFAYTNHTDTETKGYANQYSSIAGSGAGGSSNYAVLYSWSKDTLVFTVPEKVTNISISNSTYAYYAMLEGDAFAKKFGGTTGNDPDYFRLIISPLDASKVKLGTFTINLADFTYANNTLDYVANAWSDFDLSPAGFVSYLVFSFESTDAGEYGINTPTYVCIDNIYGELAE